jgi:hypothetical protein
VRVTFSHHYYIPALSDSIYNRRKYPATAFSAMSLIRLT